MKPSSEWVQQPEVDQAGDAILAEGKVTLATITAYQVAKRLDRAANPTLYRLFRHWRARRQADAEPVTIDVPPEVEASIRAIFARLTDDGVGACLGAVRVVGGSLDRVAMLRIGDAERRADRAEAETTEVVSIGEMIEEELRAAKIRIAELEQALADGRRREDRLAGRIDQLDADLAAARRPHRKEAAVAATPAVDDAGRNAAAGAGDAGDAGDAGSGSSNVSVAARAKNQLRLTFAGFEADDEQGGRDAR